MKNNRGNKKNTFTRLIKTLFEFYPVLLPVIIFLILFSYIQLKRFVKIITISYV